MASTTTDVISSEFPFVKKKVHIQGSEMAYVDVGNSSATTIVFLHGNPTSSYLWRNIIPYVSGRARCIAPDLIGFGDSDKVPGLAYRVSDHQRYLDAFLDKVLPAEKIILVIHDWGSALGLDWARRHEDRVAGLAFMEFIPPTKSWAEFKKGFRNLFSQFRDPELGRKLLIEQNLFVEQVLQSGIVRPLSEQEMNEYRRPFVQPESREPLYRFPNELPIEGHPAETWEMAQKYMTWLFASDVPKLFFWVTPGTFIWEDRAKKFMEILKSTRSVYLGSGLHFVQEDHPHTIGRELADWLPLKREGLL
jgi:haloalkane dehalogenase